MLDRQALLRMYRIKASQSGLVTLFTAGISEGLRLEYTGLNIRAGFRAFLQSRAGTIGKGSRLSVSQTSKYWLGGHPTGP